MRDFFKFLDESPTAFHAVKNIVSELDKDSFVSFGEGDSWKLFPGIKGYVTRNSSSVIAFGLPHKSMPIKGFKIYAAHTDSPCFRIKENPEMDFEGKYIRLNAEKYGGMIYSSWLDRPLSVAGRVFVKANGEITEKLFNVNKDMAVIPNVAIHMNGDINKGYEYKPQTDLLALVCSSKNRGSFIKEVAKAANVKPSEILGSDMFLYPRSKATKIGTKDEFVLSPRLDDLACVYAGLKGIIEAEPGDYVRVFAAFDNEEVGSMTKQGADSTFLYDTLFRICEELSMSQTDFLKALSNSFFISADNAHGVHPSMPSKADPTNRPVLNGGVVVKFNGNQRYATDAYSHAVLRDICNTNDIPLQTYANNSDIPGGSTFGNISTAHVSIPTVDIGLAELSMHSAAETMGIKDEEYLVSLAKAFLSL